MALKVSVAQRQARLVERQLLGSPVATVDEVARALGALHATDPVTVYLSAWARSRCALADVDAALYERRSLLRMLGMRRTVFVIPAGLAGAVQAACTDDVAKRMRRQLEKDLAGGGVGDGDPGGWLRSVEAGVLRVLAERGGGASGAQLSADEPRLRTQLTYAPDKPYGGTANITSRVLVLIAAEGLMIRGHRRGGWSSGQFEWFLPQPWLAGGDATAQAGADGTGAPAADGWHGDLRSRRQRRRWRRWRRARRRPRPGRGAGRAGPPLAARLRPGTTRRPAVVGRVDGRAGQGRPGGTAGHRGRP